MPQLGHASSLSSDSASFYYGTRNVTLPIKQGIIAVKFSTDLEPDARMDLIKHTTGLASTTMNESIPYFNVWFIKYSNDNMPVGTNISSILRELSEHSQIAMAYPLLELGNSLLIPTDEIIARFDRPLSSARMHALLNRYGLDYVRSFEWSPETLILRIRNPRHLGLFSTIEHLLNERDLLSVEPNFIHAFPTMDTPNDPLYTQQWALHNTGQSICNVAGIPGADISAAEAWNLATGKRFISIAIIDVGVDLTHEDLSANLIEGYDAVDGDNDASANTAFKRDAHGTACAGIAAGATNNGIGISGLARNCTIMPIKMGFIGILDGDTTIISTAAYKADAIATAAMRGADVISISWGWNGSIPSSDSTLLDFAISFAKTHGRDGKGCVICCAAGNDFASVVSYPARNKNVIAVAATDAQDRHCQFSNIGPEISIAAPGLCCWTTDAMGALGYEPGNYYLFSGTSCSAPYAAGLAALILSVDGTLSADSVKTIMEMTADDDTIHPGPDSCIGYGRINAFRALQAVQPFVPIRYVHGTISTEEFWHADSVYVIDGYLTIASSGVLHIEAGTVVKFKQVGSAYTNNRLSVYGVLDAQGTEGNEVVFTSSRDDTEGGDTNGDQGATIPSSNDWGYIRIYNSANVIRHCRFKYGGYIDGNTYMLFLDNLSPAVPVENCQFMHGKSTGLYYVANTGFATAPLISGNTFSSVPNAIKITGDSTRTVATISGNVMTGGSGTGIDCTGLAAGSVVTLNTMAGYSTGIKCDAISAGSSITSNSITGGGLSFTNTSPAVSNNTLINSPSYPLAQNGTSFPVYSGNTISGNAVHAISVNGTIGSSGVWVPIPDDSLTMVYEISGYLTISNGTTLTIPAGTVVKFKQVGSGSTNNRLDVHGILDAQGTEGNEVVFTSSRDDTEGGDTNGDQGATIPSSSDWGYIRIYNSANTIRHCRFKYGGYLYSYQYALVVEGVSPAVPVENCQFTRCSSTGLYYAANTGFATTPLISGNTFSNVPNAIKITGDSTRTVATISGNVMTGGSGTGIDCTGLAAGSLITQNTLENCTTGISCSQSRCDLANNALMQSGGSIGTGTGMTIKNGSTVSISGNDIQYHSIGLSSESGSGNSPSTLHIHQNKFINNSNIGLRFGSTSVSTYTGPYVTANNNDIHDNGAYNLYLGPYQNPSTAIINAENNWWGTTDAEMIAASIYDYLDSNGSAIADYMPYRDIPIVPGVPSISITPASISWNLFPNEESLAQISVANGSTANVLTYSIQEGVSGAAAVSGINNLLHSPMPGVEILDHPERALNADVSWLHADPASGIVSPLGNATVSISLNSSDLSDGRYIAYLVISSNDPDNNPLIVPVTMSVNHVLVLAPAGPDTLASGSTCEITWMAHEPALVEHVDIFYTIDAGRSYIPIAVGEPNDSSFLWDVPAHSADSCAIKVVAYYSGGTAKEGISSDWFSISDESTGSRDNDLIARGFDLQQNYPNPFNPSTTIIFNVPYQAHVTLGIYSAAGKLIAILVDQQMPAGRNEVRWTGEDSSGATVASGIYFCRFAAGDFVQTRKMVLLR